MYSYLLCSPLVFITSTYSMFNITGHVHGFFSTLTHDRQTELEGSLVSLSWYPPPEVSSKEWWSQIPWNDVF